MLIGLSGIRASAPMRAIPRRPLFSRAQALRHLHCDSANDSLISGPLKFYDLLASFQSGLYFSTCPKSRNCLGDRYPCCISVIIVISGVMAVRRHGQLVLRGRGRGGNVVGEAGRGTRAG